MNIRAYGSSREQCESVLKIADTAFEKEIGNLQKSGVVLSVSQVSDNYYEGYSKEIAQKQADAAQAREDALKDFKDFQTSYIDGMTDQEKAYYSLLTSESNTSSFTNKTIKYSAIGALIGMLASIIIEIISYLSSPYVHTTDDVKKSFNMCPLIAVISVGGHKQKGLDKCFCNLADHIDQKKKASYGTSTGENISFASDRIAKLCKKHSSNNVLLAFLDEDTKKSASELGCSFDERGIHVNDCTGLREILNRSNSASVVVPVICRNKTKKIDCMELQQLCQENNIPVLGMLFIEES